MYLITNCPQTSIPSIKGIAIKAQQFHCFFLCVLLCNPCTRWPKIDINTYTCQENFLKADTLYTASPHGGHLWYDFV